MKKPDYSEDKNVCLGLARSVSPYKTGNVRFNAMQAYITTNGFVINYSLADAYYIYFLEEGTKKSSKYKGFIGTRTVLLLSDYLFSKYKMIDESAVNDYQIESMYGNSDEDSYKGQDYLAPRQEAQYESRLANMVNYGHMSNEFGWQHDPSIELTQSEFNNRFNK